MAEACAALCSQMMADAEGASKIFQVRVTGARSDAEAHRAARKVADSLLVKCSLNGEDPYWGRVVSELGSAGVDFDMDRLADRLRRGDGVPGRHRRRPRPGRRWPGTWPGRCSTSTANSGLADGNGVVMGVDLGHGYIDENRTTS